jgi:hypothetical protein
MESDELDDAADLINHLAQTTRLSGDEAAKVIQEVTGYLHETVGQYVQRRHRELKQQGALNQAIYPRLLRELRQRRFRADDYSERQIRRLIYG